MVMVGLFSREALVADLVGSEHLQSICDDASRSCRSDERRERIPPNSQSSLLAVNGVSLTISVARILHSSSRDRVQGPELLHVHMSFKRVSAGRRMRQLWMDVTTCSSLEISGRRCRIDSGIYTYVISVIVVCSTIR